MSSFFQSCHLQVVPHITDEIQDWIERVAMIPVDGKEGPADVCVIELGGTIGTLNSMVLISGGISCFPVSFMLKDNFMLSGDIESMPFIEALGQFSYRVGKNITQYNTM